MNRRELLQALSSIAVLSAADRAFALGAPPDAGTTRANIQFGAQTNAWAIDPNNLDSFLSVLNQIKQVGYAGFETGFFNLANQFNSPRSAAERIAATGLVFTGIHIAIPFNRNDPATHLPPASLYEPVARGGRALGAQRLIFSGARSQTSEDVKRKVEALDTAGRFANSVGLGFAYHNHWWEFQSEVNEIETLYATTDPSVVSFLLDAGHAYRGGANVPEFLRQHSKRIAALHLRDYRDGHLVPLGEGTFPLTEVAATLRELRWRGWAINEEEREDATKGGLGYIEPAYKAMREAFDA